MEFQPASKLFLTDNAWYEIGGGLCLFFIKSKSPVAEPSVKLSAGCSYNTVLLSLLDEL